MRQVQGSKVPRSTMLDALPAGPQVQPFQTDSTWGYTKMLRILLYIYRVVKLGNSHSNDWSYCCGHIESHSIQTSFTFSCDLLISKAQWDNCWLINLSQVWDILCHPRPSVFPGKKTKLLPLPGRTYIHTYTVSYTHMYYCIYAYMHIIIIIYYMRICMCIRI